MDNIKEFQNRQEAKQLHNKVISFLKDFHVGSLLNGSGIRKFSGASPLQIFTTIFLLPFEDKNFYRGLVTNKSLEFKKDAAYMLLRNPRHNWRNFMLKLAAKIAGFFSLLTSENREKVFIFDDSTFHRERSKAVELLARVFDHNSGIYLNGFKLLTLGWSDGVSFLPLDFVMRSSSNESSRIQGITKKKLDKRTCGYKRRIEAMRKTTEVLGEMVKRALKAGLSADYILMDSWFCFPVIIAELNYYMPVICMGKNLKNIHYFHCNAYVTLAELYRRVEKKPGRSNIKASVVVRMKNGPEVKIVFVRHRGGKKWLAILSTRTDLPDEEIVRIYGKRWDIEVFFKMTKHYLNMEKEAQLRDYDGIVGHTTIVMARYMFLAFEQRLQEDPKTLGSLFHACCDDMKDLTILDALRRILALAYEKVRYSNELAEKVVVEMIDTIMGAAIEVLKSFQRTSKFAL